MRILSADFQRQKNTHAQFPLRLLSACSSKSGSPTSARPDTRSRQACRRPRSRGRQSAEEGALTQPMRTRLREESIGTVLLLIDCLEFARLVCYVVCQFIHVVDLFALITYDMLFSHDAFVTTGAQECLHGFCKSLAR
jgi:hypothetical protein